MIIIIFLLFTGRGTCFLFTLWSNNLPIHGLCPIWSVFVWKHNLFSTLTVHFTTISIVQWLFSVQLWKLLGNYLKKRSTLVDNQRWTGANGRGGGVTGAGGRTVLCRPPSESRATALEGVEERFMKKRENDFSNLHQFYSYMNIFSIEEKEKLGESWSGAKNDPQYSPPPLFYVNA